MKMTDILRVMAQPVPENLISKKKVFQKGKPAGEVDFIAWYNLCDLLDDIVGIDSWEWEVRDVVQVGNRLTLTGILTIHAEDKSLTRMSTGTEDLDCSSYGDPSSNAEAMALRRCCAKFGLGRDLWRKEKGNSSNSNSSKPKPKTIQQIPFKTQEEAIQWGMKTTGLSSKEIQKILNETPLDKEGKKSSNFYKRIMEIKQSHEYYQEQYGEYSYCLESPH